jgi:ornithine carbamoyltransferase
MNRFKGRDFISLKDYTREELYFYLHTAEHMKSQTRADVFVSALVGRSLAMVFQKPSLRTRASFDIGMHQLGGHAIYLGPDEIQLGKREAIKDVASVLDRYADGIMARVFAHDDILELATHAHVPVINGLSDLLHPCQALADYLTLLERFGSLEELRLAYIGDGNNVCHSLIYGAQRFGLSLRIATPKGYAPDRTILEENEEAGLDVMVTTDPQEAVKKVDVVYTDSWVSMGQEDEQARRERDFAGFTIDSSLLEGASSRCVVMHCLPAHRGKEITDDVIDGPRSIVFDQAENRLHAQKAILALNLR